MTDAIQMEGLPPRREGTESLDWWAMALTIVTEAAFFVCLLFGYFYLQSLHPEWPPEMPRLRISLPNTAILLASSVALWWAERGIRNGQELRLRLGIAVTLVLGSVFVCLQILEYHELRFTPATDAYGSVFFTVTGFHGAHVVVGLMILLFVLARALAGHFSDQNHRAVKNAAMYWHFVDAVWIAVFTSLYLTPRLA
jgi:heme/copper-type cytochrome/quinol oxidase subunit 3